MKFAGRGWEVDPDGVGGKNGGGGGWYDPNTFYARLKFSKK